MIERPLLLARLLPPALRVAAVLAFVALVQWSGFGAAGDELLRHQYYGLRGERGTTQQVMLVAIDAPSVAAWGAPPYKNHELDAVFAAIERGAPRVVGVVDDPARIGMLPANVIVGRPALELDANVVRTVRMGPAEDPTVTARIATAAKLAVDRERVMVNYVGRRGLPMVSAVDVAHGKIPNGAFAGKIVVVGLTAQPHAELLPTPVGPLAAAQIQTHALSSLADGVAWEPTPTWLRMLVILLVCVLGVLLAHHLMMVSAMVGTAATAAVLILTDYTLFATGSSLFGATLPLVATFASAASERVYERVVLHRYMRDIAHWTRRWMLLETMRTEVPDDKPGYWRRVGQLARLFLGCNSSIIAELPAGQDRLKLRVLGGTGTQQIRERRMDIGRAPYRKAHLTLGPVWHDEFMTDGTKTLLVPLVIRNTTLIGFWMVSFESRDAVTEANMGLIKTLAKEIAMAIDRRRSAPAPVVQRGIKGWLLGARRFSHELDEVRRAFATHTQNQQDLLTLGESMPFGVFVSTLWGDIRYANTAMKAASLDEGIDPSAATTDIAELISKLTGRRVREVHRNLRELVQGQRELHLRGRERGEHPSFDIMLSWLKSSSDDGEQLLVGCVLPRTLRMRSAPPPGRPASDEHAVTSQRERVEADDSSVALPTFEPEALTLPSPKVELELPPAPLAQNITLPRTKVEVEPPPAPLAHGTPTFHDEEPPRLDPAELEFGGATLIGHAPTPPDSTPNHDSTLRFSQPELDS